MYITKNGASMQGFLLQPQNRPVPICIYFLIRYFAQNIRGKGGYLFMRYLTAGESHGKQLTTIIEGLPARMPLIKDEIDWNKDIGYYWKTRRLGEFEGGMTKGMPIKGVMKPIPTLYKPLQSIDINSKAAFNTSVERSA